jgi:hypothetical protein
MASRKAVSKEQWIYLGMGRDLLIWDKCVMMDQRHISGGWLPWKLRGFEGTMRKGVYVVLKQLSWALSHSDFNPELNRQLLGRHSCRGGLCARLWFSGSCIRIFPSRLLDSILLGFCISNSIVILTNFTMVRARVMLSTHQLLKCPPGSAHIICAL